MIAILALSSRDYNGMASNLSVAPRSFAGQKTVSAYERALVGDVAGFTTIKMDYANRIAAAAGTGITVNTTAGGGQHYTPVATTTAATGETSNYDNRYQNLTVSATTNVLLLVTASQSLALTLCITSRRPTRVSPRPSV